MERAEIAVVFDGVALAGRARVGQVQTEAVAVVRHRAAVLPADHPVRRAIDVFCTAWAAARCDRDTLFAAGTDLDRDLRRWLRPVPVDAGRVDIHG